MEILRVIVMCCILNTTAAICNHTICNECQESSGKCLSCKSGYFVNNFKNCTQCTDSNCLYCTGFATCEHCADGFYKYTSTSGYTNCSPCPKGCIRCKSLEQCTACKREYYGVTCAHSCQDHCLVGDCMTDRCLRRCKDGYYQDRDAVCRLCLFTCKTCSNNDSCNSCKYASRYGSACVDTCIDTCPDGTCDISSGRCAKTCAEGQYLNQNSQCALCSANCMNGADCRHGDGACVDGCKPGWAGVKCSENCSENCLSCLQYTPNTCDTCKQGRYGVSCQNRCKNCESNTTETICRKADGACTSGCTTGSWGSRCDKNCSDGCLKDICYQDNGLCFRCQPDKHGAQCDQECSRACVYPGNSSNVCQQSDGVCVFGCSPGKEGQECSKDCHSQAATQTDSSSDNTVTSVLSGIAAIAVAINIAAVVIIVRMRKQHVGSERKNTNIALDVIASSGQPQGAEHQAGTRQPRPESSNTPYTDLTLVPGRAEHPYGTAYIGPETSENPYMSLDTAPDINEHQYGDLAPK